MTPTWQSDCGTVKLYLGDCLTVLPHVKADCVVTDPPYGIKADRGQRNRANKQHGAALAPSKDYGESNWDTGRPPRAFFDAMRASSKEQVIFGGNYFADLLPPSRSWIVWDKDNGTNDYADFELAWTSHNRAARKVRWRWHGMLQEPGHPRDTRVHPTQKPLGLMRWVIENYTAEGDTVLDPMMGSGTTIEAAIRLGRKAIGIELDPHYFWDLCVPRAKRALAERAAQLPFEEKA